MVHPCHEPASDVAASGNSGEIVEFAQQPELRESLKDSKVKCGASDAAPGKSQPDQAVGRIPGVLFGFKPLKPAASNLRSEERRVGKECRSRASQADHRKNANTLED